MSSNKSTSARKVTQRRASDLFHQFPQAQFQEFKEAFSFIDSNKDGFIDKNDLRATWDSLGRIYSDADLDSMINEATGTLNFTQFLAMVGSRIKNEDKDELDLKRAFETFDEDHCGKIHVDNLKQALTKFGEKLTDEEIEAALSHAPIDSKGNIDIIQYVATISGEDEVEAKQHMKKK